MNRDIPCFIDRKTQKRYTGGKEAYINREMQTETTVSYINREMQTETTLHISTGKCKLKQQ